MHYQSDVLAAWVLGSAWLTVVIVAVCTSSHRAHRHRRPRPHRPPRYRHFAGGALAVALYDQSVTALTITVAAIQALALIVVVGLLTGARRHRT